MHVSHLLNSILVRIIYAIIYTHENYKWSYTIPIKYTQCIYYTQIMVIDFVHFGCCVCVFLSTEKKATAFNGTMKQVITVKVYTWLIAIIKIWFYWIYIFSLELLLQHLLNMLTFSYGKLLNLPKLSSIYMLTDQSSNCLINLITPQSGWDCYFGVVSISIPWIVFWIWMRVIITKTCVINDR